MAEIATPGKLVPPFPVKRCALNTCRAELAAEAFLYRDMQGGKLVVFCGDCAPNIDLNPGLRFRLVAL